jgi:hypothetical protein
MFFLHSKASPAEQVSTWGSHWLYWQEMAHIAYNVVDDLALHDPNAEEHAFFRIQPGISKSSQF